MRLLFRARPDADAQKADERARLQGADERPFQLRKPFGKEDPARLAAGKIRSFEGSAEEIGGGKIRAVEGDVFEARFGKARVAEANAFGAAVFPQAFGKGGIRKGTSRKGTGFEDGAEKIRALPLAAGKRTFPKPPFAKGTAGKHAVGKGAFMKRSPRKITADKPTGGKFRARKGQSRKLLLSERLPAELPPYFPVRLACDPYFLPQHDFFLLCRTLVISILHPAEKVNERKKAEDFSQGAGKG